MPPGRRIVGTGSVVSTTVDSRPMPQLPPSSMPAILPCISSSTSCAFVGLGRPEILADGAAIGQPQARIKSCANLFDGKRTATVSKPALTASGTMDDLLTINVSGPGQKCSISFWALAFKPVVSGAIASFCAICKISGLSFGRPLAAKILATAVGFSPSAPRPYTVSVGKETTSPALISAAACSIASLFSEFFCNFQ